MNIIGPDTLVFGVDDAAACMQYLIDYGLLPVHHGETGGRFEALDGTGIEIAHRDDPALPPGLGTASMLRKTIYGVADIAALEAIATGAAHAIAKCASSPMARSNRVDDMGFALRLPGIVRRSLSLAAEPVNAPGAPAQRAPNVVAVRDDAVLMPRTLVARRATSCPTRRKPKRSTSSASAFAAPTASPASARSCSRQARSIITRCS